MRVIALSGLTECGKGTAARYLERYGIARLKIGDMLLPLHRRSGSPHDFQAWNFQEEASRPVELFDGLISELRAYAAANRVEAMSIDSLYGATLARHLQARLSLDATVIYIDAPESVRLQRQCESAGIELEEARRILSEKDAFKRARGNLEVRPLADFVVDNGGSMETFAKQLDEIVVRRLDVDVQRSR